MGGYIMNIKMEYLNKILILNKKNAGILLKLLLLLNKFSMINMRVRKLEKAMAQQHLLYLFIIPCYLPIICFTLLSVWVKLLHKPIPYNV
jgi:hypothetical protein